MFTKMPVTKQHKTILLVAVAHITFFGVLSCIGGLGQTFTDDTDQLSKSYDSYYTMLEDFNATAYGNESLHHTSLGEDVREQPLSRKVRSVTKNQGVNIHAESEDINTSPLASVLGKANIVINAQHYARVSDVPPSELVEHQDSYALLAQSISHLMSGGDLRTDPVTRLQHQKDAQHVVGSHVAHAVHHHVGHAKRASLCFFIMSAALVLILSVGSSITVMYFIKNHTVNGIVEAKMIDLEADGRTQEFVEHGPLPKVEEDKDLKKKKRRHERMKRGLSAQEFAPFMPHQAGATVSPTGYAPSPAYPPLDNKLDNDEKVGKKKNNSTDSRRL